MSRRACIGDSSRAARRLLLLTVAAAPLLALACAATSEDEAATPAREAGVLEASSGKDAARADDEEAQEASVRDGGVSVEAGKKDAGVDAGGGAPAAVHINEIYVDIDLFGDGAEFVELRAAPGTPVDDLKLRLIDSTGNVDYVVNVAAPGAQVGATGLWVVGGAQVFKLGVQHRVDEVVSLTGWGLETSRGAVQLLRGAQLLDVVGWSSDPDAGPSPAPGSPPLATVEGSPAGVPTIVKTVGNPAHSFGRSPGAADTNDNRADFCSMAASPGYAQNPCD